MILKSLIPLLCVELLYFPLRLKRLRLFKANSELVSFTWKTTCIQIFKQNSSKMFHQFITFYYYHKLAFKTFLKGFVTINGKSTRQMSTAQTKSSASKCEHKNHRWRTNCTQHHIIVHGGLWIRSTGWCWYVVFWIVEI